MHINQLFGLNGTKHIGNNKFEGCLIHAVECIQAKYFIFLLILIDSRQHKKEWILIYTSVSIKYHCVEKE